MIDESDVAVEACRGEEGGFGDFGNGLEGFGVDEFEVVDGEAIGRVSKKMSASGIEVDLRVLFTGFANVTGGDEGAANAGSVGSFVGFKS